MESDPIDHIFATLTDTSLASGALVAQLGWQAINLYSIPPVLAVGLGLLWLVSKRPKHLNANT